jgi:predicted nucleic acid-binding protein
MRVLLDTCVLSELYKPEPLVTVYEAVNNVPDEHLFISVITLGEIGKGIALLPDGQRKQALLKWFTNIEYEYSERLLPINAETAAIWGKITAKAQQEGYVIHASDGLIAATALQHGLHLMTRNVKDFEPTHVMLINPWIKGIIT